MGKNERRGWILVAVFLLGGLLCVILAGNLAIRFAPRWTLQADMRSRLDPNAAFLTFQSDTVVLPVDSAILTPPTWINVFLTPGQSFPTRIPRETATPGESIPAPTQLPPTTMDTASPTSTLFYYAATQTSRPSTTMTLKPSLPTATGTLKPTLTATPGASISTSTASSIPSYTPIPQADLQVTKSDGVVVYSSGGTLTYTVVVYNNGPSDVRGAVVSDVKPPQILDWSWTCTSEGNGSLGCDPAGSSDLDFNDQVDLPRGASIVYTVVAHTRGDTTDSITNTAFITSPADVPDPVPGNNSATDTNEYPFPLPYGQIGTTPNGSHSDLAKGTSTVFAFDPSNPLVVDGHPSWDLILYEMPNGSGIAMDLIIFQIGDGSNWYTILNWGDNVADTDTNMNINIFGGTETDNRDFTSPPNSDYLYPFNGTPDNPATGIVFDLDGFVPNGSYPYFRIISPVGGDIDGGCEVDAVTVLRP